MSQTTAVSLIFGPLIGAGYDARRPYVEFRKTKLAASILAGSRTRHAATATITPDPGCHPRTVACWH